MENLTYEAYLANPAIRDQIEREVRQMRTEAFSVFTAGLRRMLSRCVPVLKLKTLKLKVA